MPNLADLLGGLSQGYVEEYQGQRKRQQEQAGKIALAEAEARAKAAYDPEAILKNRLINLARSAGMRVAPPGGFSRAELENPDLERAIAPAREQAEMNILRHILPSRALSTDTNVFAFDPSTGTVQPAPGGTRLPPGSRVLQTRITPEEAGAVTGARTAERIRQGATPEALTATTETAQARATGTALGTQAVKYQDLVKQFGLISKDVDSVLGSLEKIPSGRMAGGVGAPITSLLGLEGSESVQRYTRNKDFILSKIAKTFGGEVGVLTEGDIKRISKAFPALWMNDRERESAVEWVKDYIKRRIEEYNQSSLQPSGSPGEDFSQYSDEELQAIVSGAP